MIRIQQTGTQPHLGEHVTGILADNGSCQSGPDLPVRVSLEIDVAPDWEESTTTGAQFEILLGLTDLNGEPLPLGPADRPEPENVQLHLTPEQVRRLAEQLQAMLLLAELADEHWEACRR